MSSSEIEQRVMTERRPQGMPPTPGNPALEGNYAALDAIAELGSDDPTEVFQKRREQQADAWAEVLSTAHRVMIGRELLTWK